MSTGVRMLDARDLEKTGGIWPVSRCPGEPVEREERSCFHARIER